MLLPIVLNSMNNALKERQVNEILKLNDDTREYGLVLKSEEVLQILDARNKYLQHVGRIELGIEVSKSIIHSFCNSSYIAQDGYVDALHELHEIFYSMKNETEDKIGDEKLIRIMKDFYEKSSGGSLELLKSQLLTFAEDFRKKNQQLHLMQKEDSQ